MSMTRDHGDFVFECDSCGNALETNEDDFNVAISALKREGWKSAKSGSSWKHICPDCTQEEDRW